MKALTTEHTLLIANALAASVVLAHDEKNVATVFGVIQPIARELAEHGRTPGGRRAILKHIGNALLVQHRVSGLVAVAEKPDVLWERPDLERFYARLEDEYELKERADVLTRKLTVISDSAKAFADIIDTERSLRLELIIVVLIAVEIVIAGVQLLVRVVRKSQSESASDVRRLDSHVLKFRGHNRRPWTRRASSPHWSAPRPGRSSSRWRRGSSA